jgi:peptide chain release factor 1
MLDLEKDEEMRELMKEEIRELELNLPELEEKLKLSLLPKDKDDDKNIIVEIRA